MTNDTRIAILIYPLVQAVFFGAGTIAILTTSLSALAMTLMPAMIAVTALLSIPVALWIAPRLRARFERRRPTVHQ